MGFTFARKCRMANPAFVYCDIDPQWSGKRRENLCILDAIAIFESAYLPVLSYDKNGFGTVRIVLQ